MAEDQPGETALTSTRQKIINDEKVSFFKLFSFADRSDVVLMILGSIGAIANGLAQPLMTVIFGQVINSFGTSSNQDVVHEISQVCPKYVYLAVGAGIAATLQVSCWIVAGERQATRIRGMYLKTILRQDITFFDTEATTGEVIGRMSGDTITIQDAMGEKVGKFLQLSSTFIGGFVVAFIKGWRLAIILTSITPLLVLVGGAMGMITSSMISRAQAAYAKAGQVVEQTVGGIRTVQSFTGEKQAICKYDDNITIAYKATCFQGLVSGLAIGSICLIFFGSYGLAIWYGSKLIIHNGYNGGRIINVIFAIMTGGMSLGQTAPCLSAFASGRAAAYKMIETSKRKPKIDAYDATGVVLEDIKGDIELKDVYFRYPARPDIQIFSGLSIYIPSGSTAALVGHSGSGKSTVISLLERFYDPDSGQVLVDGVNLKTMRLKWIREKMGLVSQEPILFAGTIKENIAYGKENATDEEIQSAIELANAAKFLNKLPKGLDTMVGEHGTALSGGQKQRIAIARAIIKNPRILLLDEATSALDAESERVVQKALDRVMADRTTVVVAHRLTTIRHADIIAVVHAGKLVQQGTHDELIKDPNGAYSQLVQMQIGSKQAEETTGVETDKEETVPEIYRSLSPRMPSRKSTGSRVGIINENEVVDKTETDEKNKGVRKDISLMRLASLNKPELPVLLLGSIAASIHGLVFPIFGLLLSTAIKIFFEPPHELQKDSKHWALMFFYFGIVTFVVIPGQNYFFGVAGGKLIQRIRSLSFAKIAHQDITWFDDPANSSGALGARLSTDASTMRSLVGDDLAIKVQNISTIIAGLVIAFTANWILAIIILVLLPLIGLQGFLQMKFYKGFSADAKAMYEEASSVANDAVGSIRTVASFCAEEKVMDMYQKKCEAPLKAGIKLGIGSGIGFGFGAFALYCTYSLCFYIGSVLQEHGKATFAEIFKVFFALTMTAMGVSQAAGLTPDLNKAKDAAASIFQILDSKPKIDSSSDDGTTLATMKGDIELQHVSFKYPTRPDIQIFKDMCLTIPAGKTVALVGESGSGKSTVISLIERFYDPDSGHVYLDGVAIKMLKLSWLRQQMGLVSQEPILFNETIRSNITYGKKGVATEEEIIEATTAANAHSFISSLPQGYDTSVGERGVQLSGGQKQRIAIARAILKDPRILLLDEATSALDAESERVVQDALERVMVNRTTVVVAHRLGTIKGADVIAVVKDGVIAEKGNHDSLMNVTDGLYASMLALHTSST